MPERIQLKRTAGWRMPPNTVKVDRSTAFGNPFRVGPGFTAAEAQGKFRHWLAGDPAERQRYPDLEARRAELLRRLPELRGKNLACWCKLGEPCHGDVLLALANADERPQA